MAFYGILFNVVFNDIGVETNVYLWMGNARFNLFYCSY